MKSIVLQNARQDMVQTQLKSFAFNAQIYVMYAQYQDSAKNVISLHYLTVINVLLNVH
jgi:hypothetical protein